MAGFEAGSCATVSFAVFVVLVTLTRGGASSEGEKAVADDVQEQLRVLSKQVTALLERRKEDLRIIEEDMRRQLLKSREMEEFRIQMEDLR